MCSVLFCDLVGFTSLAEGRDPEGVRELLDRYFDVTRTIITRYAGTVEKFIGDAVMAVWGTPTADEHDAERAVRAALDVVDAVAHIGAEEGASSLAARASVVTGIVAVALGATGQGMVAGDAVNTAARIQTAAESGTVLVDEGTRKAVGASISFDAAGEHTLKGKGQLVTLWRADRVVAGVGGSQRVDGLEAPLVGRNAELRLLKALFHASVERRTTKLVSVVGAAGVGKSRLGWEFEKYVDGLADSVRWHRGRCLSYGDGVAFFALAEMVRQRFGISEDDTPTDAGLKLRDQLPRWLDDPADISYVRPRLAQLLGVDPGQPREPLGREELFAGWRLFFERMATAAPVLLIVEDFHYADPGLLDFIEHLVDWARDVPIFVLTLARPELGARRVDWGAGRASSTSVNLDALDSTAMDLLLDGLVPGMPTKAKTAVANRAEGIPLYAVETVRMLIDRDVVRPIEGVYRLVGDVKDLSIPESLHSLLAARLDAFGADTRRLIADASVLGGSFPREALIAISTLPDERSDELIEHLVRREVLAVRADPLSPERGHYTFVQTMLREVAYDTQSRRDRKSRHLAVAEHLERTFPDGGEAAEVVASHLCDALDAIPDAPDVPVLRERAVAKLSQAGERAERTGSPRSAARAFARAAALLITTGTPHSLAAAAERWERAGLASKRAGESEAVNQLRQAASIYREIERPRDAARADAQAGITLGRLGRMTEGRGLLRKALDVLEADADADTVAALSGLAGLEVFAGNPEGEQLSASALALAEQLDLPDVHLARLLLTHGFAHLVADRPVQAIAYLREAVVRAEAADDSGCACGALMNLSDALVDTDASAASAAARAAIDHGRRIGDRFGLSMATGNLIEALCVSGSWDEAQAVFMEATHSDGLAGDSILANHQILMLALRGSVESEEVLRTVVRASDDAQQEACLSMASAAVAAMRGDHRSALREARHSLEFVESLGISSDAIRWAWPIAADAALDLGDVTTARDLVKWLDSQSRRHLPRLLRAVRARIWARILGQSHDSLAAEAFTVAVTELRGLGSPYHLAVGLLDQADYLTAAGELATASSSADEAVLIAERLGARPLAQRAARIVTRDDAPFVPS